MTRSPFCLVLAGLATIAAVAQAEDPEVSIVWQAGTDGYHTYRIPAVLVAQNGDLLAFCEGRRNNSRDHGNVDLLMKRSTDGGRTWSEQQIVYEEGGDQEITIGNPCPVLDSATGTIWLPLTKDNDRVLMTHSADHGRTWAKPTDITADVKRPGWGWYATVPGVGIQLIQGTHQGRLVIPCDHRDKDYDCGSHVIYSDDHGTTWQMSADVVQPGANECQVVELFGATLLLSSRMQEHRDKGYRGRSLSRDGGNTWTPLVEDDQLKDPKVQASLIRRASRVDLGPDLLLFSNPDSPLSSESGARIDLTVRASRDNGKTWPRKQLLHSGPSAYSCLVSLPADGMIGCLYEAGEKSAYEGLRFQRLSLEMLRDW